MANDEAINILNKDKDISFQGLIDDDLLTEEDIEHIEAYEMAIEALKAQKVGKWIEENINEWSHKVFCSECGCTAPFEHVSNGDIYSAGGYGINIKTKFCPHCGARMEGQE